jgi:DeoR/GlpR family transcriptional regulator of sugar metabolism
MFAYERKSKIIDYLEQNGQAEVNTLSDMLGVVPETIRRDFRELESQGILTRTHGGAILISRKEKEYPIGVRVMKNRPEKDRICMQAVQYVNDGDLIFIDNSSTLVNFVKYIDENVEVTILTNSINVLQEYAGQDKDNITIICTGGIFSKANMSLSGTIAGKYKYDIFPNKAFVSCHGISTEFGFTDGNFLEVGFKREMLKLSSKVYFLLDHSKFGKLGPIHLGDMDMCDVLITDKVPSEEFSKKLSQLNSKLDLVICK